MTTTVQPQTAQALTFDVRDIPFSTKGAWFDLSPVVALHTTAEDVHLVSHQTGMHAVFVLVPETDGTRTETAITASPSLLTWTASDGEIDAAFDGVTCLRIRGRGISLRIGDASTGLTPFTGTYLFRDPIDGAAVFTSYETGRRYRVTSLKGDLHLVGAEALGVHVRGAVASGGDGWEVAIEEFESARPSYLPLIGFTDVERATARDFSAYLDRLAGWRDARTPAAALAAYVMWSATVRPLGFLRQESILMSMHWMDKVWSWDHCFNALALAPGDPAAALAQFRLIFDHQDASGALPDSVTHSEILYNFVKPPIHGWAFDKLRQRMPGVLCPEDLTAVYHELSAWTDFWLNSRRMAGHELAHYQHGNDSGWDNSSTFDSDRVIEAPDLAAFLVLQLDTIARLADELGLGTGATRRTERDAMAAALLAELWDGDTFIARAPLSGRTSSATSLLNLLAIVAADFLPIEVRERVAASIAGHLTLWGPATELPSSPNYESDGYWRGPIWAPSTVIAEDGLRRAGFATLADIVSERFRSLCEKSGFAENFDAQTGEGLRDRAYTWTASSYLLLAQEALIRASDS
ncbi:MULTISPECIES: amylo-alpha-1,6-glucosidase [unclassified Cryobacterium]|uniref:amylo-alpha-1,6-glucosidase n=1 Tax=unclassified Cryobacterium TaxID=2649013 RepID=UPI002AB342C8|nr:MULTISPECIES: glycogen debranching protein [unclassified Cryobacterium]MDY7543082.1 glycogen debranching protein [Cryobacterium sp. 5B3]MEA9999917.1 glycogen debranching protein [Cryobacterium sp. RTS3]MEB0265653.1 glycogen debranching protein [Cryobacterium sp. 10I5]MEB0274467.1 glycogen debranching protein [Cryobacterium sp. 5B3]